MAQMECGTGGTVGLSGRKFAIEDYLVFGAVLTVSLVIGVFHGCCGPGGRQRTTAQFFMGDRKLNFLTLGASLTVGFTSAIAILGNVAEMYNYGTQYALTLVSFVFMVPLAVHLFLPVLRDLQITSIYEYLERRFGNGTRLLLCGLYTIQTLMYISVVVYAPALALRQVTGLETMYAVGIIFAVCVIYSSLGGIRAVVWSDTFQAAVIVVSLLVVLVRGSQIGNTSPAQVWETAEQSGRIEFFNVDWDPRVRHSLWSVVLGTTFYWVSMNAATQTAVQRLLAVPSLKDAYRAMWLSCLGMSLIYGLTFYLGLMVYAHFQHCDPLLSKAVDATDQLLPLYVMEVAGSPPGLPGLFVAGVFSASLSTVASALNAMSASTLKDLLGGGLGYKPTESRAALASKFLGVFYGVLCFAFVLFVRHLGGVLQIALTFNGMMCGVALGVFTLGMYVPRANAKGTTLGVLGALGIVLWLLMGAQLATMQGRLSHPRKQFGTLCSCSTNNVTLLSTPQPADNALVFDGYRLSYLWYSPLGWLLTVLLGYGASLLFPSPINLDSSLLASIVRPTVSDARKVTRETSSKYDESCDFEASTHM